MLLNIRNMHDMRVDDVAIPTADIASVADDATLDEVVAAFRKSTNTRLPVYSETLDNPLGLVHLKDIALNYGFGANGKFDLKSIIRPLIYVPPSMPLGALLQKMQSERVHMALVIDEYGGVEGLVTLEDLIEEIVGEIEDEHDIEEAQLWSEESPSVFIAQARAPLDEFEEA
ncbi:MAG: CBS domain-containing protein, partial [Rhodobacteraceae bacterium]|nr:CBS domain-containing protein [Paracoccaceae bacterium]